MPDAAVNINDPQKARDELDRALQTGSPDAIARAAVANIWPLFSFHYKRLIFAVEALPSSVLERYPVLRVLHPMTPVLARGARPYKPLIYQDDARAMSADELDMLTVVQMIAFRFSGDVAAALIYARRLEERILKVPSESRERPDGPLWYYHLQIGVTLLSAGDTTRSLREFATARQLAPLCGQPDAVRLALARAALSHATRGSCAEASRTLAEARACPEPGPPHGAAIAATEAAAAALVEVEHVPAEGALTVQTVEPTDSIEVSWSFALLARVRDHLARQRPHEALEVLCLARDAHPPQHGSFASDVVTAGLIETSLALGDLPAASDVSRRTSGSGVLTGLARVRLHLAEGRFANAVHALRMMLADTGLGPGHRAEANVLLAWAEFAQDGRVHPQLAARIRHLSRDASSRRILAGMPRQLVEHLAVSDPPEAGKDFRAALRGLTHPEMVERPELTAGELRVLNALAEHDTTADIASTFHVSPNTVKSQLASVYRKLGCSKRDDAVRIAARLNLLAPPGDE